MSNDWWVVGRWVEIQTKFLSHSRNYFPSGNHRPIARKSRNIILCHSPHPPELVFGWRIFLENFALFHKEKFLSLADNNVCDQIPLRSSSEIWFLSINYGRWMSFIFSRQRSFSYHFSTFLFGLIDERTIFYFIIRYRLFYHTSSSRAWFKVSQFYQSISGWWFHFTSTAGIFPDEIQKYFSIFLFNIEGTKYFPQLAQK